MTERYSPIEMSFNNSANRKQILKFKLDNQHCALYVSIVERVERAVEITPLPKAPEIVLGIINAHGKIIPVIDLRKRFRMPTREIRIDDRFVIAATSRRTVGLMVDVVTGVCELADHEIVSTRQALPFAEHLQGVAKLDGDIVLIYDLGGFLSIDEENRLDEALSSSKR